MGRKQEEKQQSISGTERVYLVPPERRGKVFRMRTAALAAISKLSEKGILKSPIEAESPVMPTGELLNRLKPYPLLQGFVLMTLTDEEWEDYVTKLPTHTSRVNFGQRAKDYLKNIMSNPLRKR